MGQNSVIEICQQKFEKRQDVFVSPKKTSAHKHSHLYMTHVEITSSSASMIGPMSFTNDDFVLLFDFLHHLNMTSLQRF